MSLMRYFNLTMTGATDHRTASHQTAKTAIRTLLLLGLLTLGLGGCFSRGAQNETAATSSQVVSGPSNLENKQTNVRITVPAEWVSAGDGLRGSADIYASYPPGDMFASVLSESKEVIEQFDLEDNAEQYRWLIENELSEYETSTRTTLDEVNGDPAVQYEIKGRVDGVPVVYLHTTVQGTDSYYQVVGWTTEERYAENKDELQEVIQSFRGT